jgi:RND family efflux transporter MFP subunit
MKAPLRALLPLAVLVIGAGTGVALIATGPEAQRRKPPPVMPTVEVLQVAPQAFPVVVRTRGTVRPRTQSTLIPEVAGRVVWIAPNLRSGGFFEAGEPLLRIDPTDYENAVTVARADLARARLALAEAEAQATQARRDWEKLGLTGEPSGLVLHVPQLDSARAEAGAAEARLKQAEADLDRTRILAPYAGRVLEKGVDVGQYVSPGTVLAEVYAVDYVEIRLPLSDEQVPFVDLPERFRGEGPGSGPGRGDGPTVTLSATIGKRTYTWDGTVVRTDGAIDTASRQLFVVAQVDNPYARHGDAPPLKVGQFVEAEITGRTLDGVFVLPRQAVEGGTRVLVVTPDDTIERRPVEVVWGDGDRVVVTGGLAAGERVSRTPLPFAADGARVNVHGDEPPARPDGPPGGAEDPPPRGPRREA